jgi:hypothetical protein
MSTAFKKKSGPNWTLFGITCAREHQTGKLTSSGDLVNTGLLKGKKKKRKDKFCNQYLHCNEE